MNDVADYDLFDYDYSTYWKNRVYENNSEKLILNKEFKDKNGTFFLDIGGSYGRLTDTYYKEYTHPIILDYSLKTLQKNKDVIKKKYPNTELIAANAYKMPFATSSIDAGLMVRVLHHIEKPEDYYKELARILNNEAFYVQEFANKMHLKAVIRALCKFDFKFFSKEPYNHPLTRSDAEGTDQGIAGIFYNFHPADVKEKMEKYGFIIIKKSGCSFFRMQSLKKILGDNTLLQMEKVQQKLLSWTNIPPSIFYSTTLKKKANDKLISNPEKLEDILVCPECKGKLKCTEKEATCAHCKHTYKKEKDIWDFRIM